MRLALTIHPHARDAPTQPTRKAAHTREQIDALQQAAGSGNALLQRVAQASGVAQGRVEASSRPHTYLQVTNPAQQARKQRRRRRRFVAICWKGRLQRRRRLKSIQRLYSSRGGFDGVQSRLLNKGSVRSRQLLACARSCRICASSASFPQHCGCAAQFLAASQRSASAPTSSSDADSICRASGCVIPLAGRLLSRSVPACNRGKGCPLTVLSLPLAHVAAPRRG